VWGKRAFDIALAVAGAVILLPVGLAMAALVAARLGRPVLFRQVRPGLGMQPFTLYKFRTMADALAQDGRCRSDEERLAGFGRVIRAAGLDELPEIFNVLAGDMSFVGPRPLLTEYLPLYSSEQARRHEVRPGITGWAQVNGRNALKWEDRFRMDVWYVDNQSFLLDAKILIMTARQLLSGGGASGVGRDAVPRFAGCGADGKGPGSGQGRRNGTEI